MNTPADRVEDVFKYMLANGLTLTSFLSIILTSVQFGDKLREMQLHILSTTEDLHDATVVRNWILTSAQAVYIKEIQALMEKGNGLHMNASKLHPAQLEVGKTSVLRPLFESKAPALWRLLQHLLVVESKGREGRRAKVVPSRSAGLGAGRDEDGCGDHVSAGHQSKGNNRERNYALLQIKGVVILSIILHGCNEQCNALQVKNSFYLAASNASKSVRQWAAHAGLAVSPSSLDSLRMSLIRDQKELNKSLGSTRIVNLAYDNCDFKFGVGQPTDLKDCTFESITTGLFFAPPKEVLPEHLEYAESIWDSHPNNPNAPNVPPMITFADVLPTTEATVRIMAHCRWHITSVLIEEHFPELRSHLLDPPSTFQLSPQQMLYSTAEAVYAKASTIDGNIDAIMSLLQQSGIVEAGVFEKYIILVHGDLGTVEKVEGILRSRRIEESALERMHYLVAIPGLFHVRMACVDAMNRIHATGKDSRSDPNGLYKRLCLLFPNDLSKLNKAVPPFQMMNDGINYITQCTILDAWTENVGGDLQKFVESKPSLEVIQRRAEHIAKEYFETKDAMYYRILVHAMNHGMVDVVVDILSFWIPIFQACGKHKYASYLLNFLFKLQQYPAPLRTAIMRCWLCNPAGKKAGFRAIDWLVELMNLYIKVVYSGTGSTKTIEYIISQSSIIQAYRTCIEDVEEDYHIPEKTLHHASPDIESRLVAIMKDLRNLRPHKYEKGRTSPTMIEDHFQKGLELFQCGMMWRMINRGDLELTDDTYEIDAADLAA
ncbi:uncharacterized protein EI90DRAFT_3152773 [Cantharellus anzutake]|uniref:uncharacterized protein n=1 Tax=Cantharellus anzutake TaxID=1750568 RepID=UPI001904BD86|nr:uncharacterized protein EI90DRAFT_3152773 [Cantharellus anzutake]KAF8335733.1 hypothetical protein EI90DRAFT_3152773 [Cantharellus anzutake]